VDGSKISAVMLDRDGVINRELGRGVLSWDEFEFLPGVLDALRRLAEWRVPIVVLSNQAAIGRGWVSADVVDGIHQKMVHAIEEHGGRIDDIVLCPHAPEADCLCRKPLPGLLLQAAEKHRFDVQRAIMVGDSHRDVQAAQAAGATPIMVCSGHPIPPELERRLLREHVTIVADLAAVADPMMRGFPFSAGRVAAKI
jgi:D-glycero-D-manno-heptose 1,7-bisphosphate phosphatase